MPIADVESVGAWGGKRAYGSDIEFKAALAQIEAGKPLLPLVIGPDIEAELYTAAVAGEAKLGLVIAMIENRWITAN